jgi:hypothetical protein
MMEEENEIKCTLNLRDGPHGKTLRSRKGLVPTQDFIYITSSDSLEILIQRVKACLPEGFEWNQNFEQLRFQRNKEQTQSSLEPCSDDFYAIFHKIRSKQFRKSPTEDLALSLWVFGNWIAGANFKTHSSHGDSLTRPEKRHLKSYSPSEAYGSPTPSAYESPLQWNNDSESEMGSLPRYVSNPKRRSLYSEPENRCVDRSEIKPFKPEKGDKPYKSSEIESQEDVELLYLETIDKLRTLNQSPNVPPSPRPHVSRYTPYPYYNRETTTQSTSNQGQSQTSRKRSVSDSNVDHRRSVDFDISQNTSPKYVMIPIKINGIRVPVEMDIDALKSALGL